MRVRVRMLLALLLVGFIACDGAMPPSIVVGSPTVSDVGPEVVEMQVEVDGEFMPELEEPESELQVPTMFGIPDGHYDALYLQDLETGVKHAYCQSTLGVTSQLFAGGIYYQEVSGSWTFDGSYHTCKGADVMALVIDPEGWVTQWVQLFNGCDAYDVHQDFANITRYTLEVDTNGYILLKKWHYHPDLPYPIEVTVFKKEK